MITFSKPQPTPEQRRTLAAIALLQQISGPNLVLCMPRVDHLNPGTSEGGPVTNCPRCGALCWARTDLPDELPAGVTVACTLCALKAGMGG